MKQSRKAKILLACFMITSLMLNTGCGRQVAEISNKHYVALITKSTDSAFWKSVYAGANAAGTEYNLNITCNGPSAEEDYTTQNMMIKNAVANGAEALVFSAVDYEANAEAINEAANQGVKIISIDSDVNSDKVSAHISTNNYQAGKMAGKAVIESGEKVLNIGIVNYAVNAENGQQREQGFRDRVKNDKRTTIISTINVPSTTEDAKAATMEMLKLHPEINVIATFNEWTSLGVGWAVKNMNLADKTMVVAFDSNVISVAMLETGEVDALVVQNPYAMGYLGVEAAYKIINGQEIENTDIDTETTLITRENMFDQDCQRILFAFD